jgi:hypothetical protein
MVIYTKKRKKPKKADFVHNKVRYWISSGDYYLDWDGEYSTDLLYTVLEYETGKDVTCEDHTLSDEEFMEKLERAGMRVMPFDDTVYFDYLY